MIDIKREKKSKEKRMTTRRNSQQSSIRVQLSAGICYRNDTPSPWKGYKKSTLLMVMMVRNDLFIIFIYLFL